MTHEETLKYLRACAERLAYTSGIALGLAPAHRYQEILEVSNDNMAFISEIHVRVGNVFKDENKAEKGPFHQGCNNIAIMEGEKPKSSTEDF